MRGEDERWREESAISTIVICKHGQGYQLKDSINEIKCEEIVWWGKFRCDGGTNGREQPWHMEQTKARNA
jgi:hypothetical protein